MDKGIKSGKEILDEFFDHLDEIPNVDEKVTILLKELYEKDKLTDKNLSNALLELRKDPGND